MWSRSIEMRSSLITIHAQHLGLQTHHNVAFSKPHGVGFINPIKEILKMASSWLNVSTWVHPPCGAAMPLLSTPPCTFIPHISLMRWRLDQPKPSMCANRILHIHHLRLEPSLLVAISRKPYVHSVLPFLVKPILHNQTYTSPRMTTSLGLFEQILYPRMIFPIIHTLFPKSTKILPIHPTSNATPRNPSRLVVQSWGAQVTPGCKCHIIGVMWLGD